MQSENKSKHTKYMKRALSLAKRGAGMTSPNPMVGAVIVKGNKIIAEGYHQMAGMAHAEVDALQKINHKAKDATMYVTLEPCSHFGRTPPCADQIIKSGISRVFVAMKDPNPLVAGRGIKKLERAGITVELGLLENEARKLNECFIKFITSKKPFVHAKSAISLDGKIATASYDSGQNSGGISGEVAHKYVQKLRKNLDAILVGGNTVLADNPRLTCRLKGKLRQPIRIVVDGHGLSPISSKVFDTTKYQTILATTRQSKAKWRTELKARGCEVWLMKGVKGHLDINELLLKLGETGISSILLEGGGSIMASFLAVGAIDRLDLIYTPRIIGTEGISFMGKLSANRLADTFDLSYSNFKQLGDDLLLVTYPFKNSAIIK